MVSMTYVHNNSLYAPQHAKTVIAVVDDVMCAVYMVDAFPLLTHPTAPEPACHPECPQRY